MSISWYRWITLPSSSTGLPTRLGHSHLRRWAKIYHQRIFFPHQIGSVVVEPSFRVVHKLDIKVEENLCQQHSYFGIREASQVLISMQFAILVTRQGVDRLQIESRDKY